MVGVGARNPHGHGDILMGRELAAEPAPDQLHPPLKAQLLPQRLGDL